MTWYADIPQPKMPDIDWFPDNTYYCEHCSQEIERGVRAAVKHQGAECKGGTPSCVVYFKSDAEKKWDAEWEQYHKLKNARFAPILKKMSKAEKQELEYRPYSMMGEYQMISREEMQRVEKFQQEMFDKYNK